MKPLAAGLCLAISCALLLAGPASAADVNPPTMSGGVTATGTPRSVTTTSGPTRGGPYYWGDVWYQDAIDWPTDLIDDVHRRLLVKGRDSLTLERAQQLLSANSAFTSVMPWRNVCLGNGGSAVPLSSVPGASLRDRPGESACRSGSPVWREYKTVAPLSRVGATVGNTIAWSVQLWREGESRPIFERAVSACRPDDPRRNDPADEDADVWWRGGEQRCSYFWANGREAGPLGTGSSTSAEVCRSRNRAAPDYFRNVEVNPRAKRLYLRLGFIKRDQDLDGGNYANSAKIKNPPTDNNWCYWSIGPGESFSARWQVNTENGQASFHWKASGRPGYFYAVHVTLVERGEFLMETTPVGNAAYFCDGDRRNFCKVFSPGGWRGVCPPDQLLGERGCTKPPPPTEDGCPPVCDEPRTRPVLGVEPVPVLELISPRYVPTRVNTVHTVTVSEPMEYDYTQAVFPRAAYIDHFTPQTRWNQGANSYKKTAGGYIAYDSPSEVWLSANSLPGTTPSLPASWQAYRLGQPAQLDPREQVEYLSLNEFRILWQRPTLESPCAAAFSLYRPLERQRGPLPPNLDTCTTSTRDVWQDYFTAMAGYEARWADDLDDSRAVIDLRWNEPLRCNGSPGQPPVIVTAGSASANGQCGSRTALHYFDRYTSSAIDLEGNPLGTTQRAQGYVYAVEPGRRFRDGTTKAWGAVVGFRLRSNNPGLISKIKVWDRDSKEVLEIKRPPTGYNTISGQPEVWFCTPGLPSGAKIFKGHDLPKRTTDWLHENIDDPYYRHKIINDEPCAGYTVRWSWDPWSDNWNTPWGFCIPTFNNRNANLNLPRRGYTYPGPNDEEIRGATNDWGPYDKSTTYYVLGDYVDYRPLLGDFVPYDGLLPGRPSVDGPEYFQEDCWKQYTGRYQYGYWAVDHYKTVTTGSYSWREWFISQAMCQMLGETVENCSTPKSASTPCPPNGTLPGTTVPGTCVSSGGTYTVPVYRWRWTGECKAPGPQAEDIPNYSELSALGLTPYITDISQTNYPTTPPPGETVGSYLDGWTCRGPRFMGNVPSGKWDFGRLPGFGWGVNHNDFNLATGPYVVQFLFTPLPIHGGVSWQLHGTYHTYSDWRWRSVVRRIDASDTVNAANATAFTNAYGPRSSG